MVDGLVKGIRPGGHIFDRFAGNEGYTNAGNGLYKNADGVYGVFENNKSNPSVFLTGEAGRGLGGAYDFVPFGGGSGGGEMAAPQAPASADRILPGGFQMPGDMAMAAVGPRGFAPDGDTYNQLAGLLSLNQPPQPTSYYGTWGGASGDPFGISPVNRQVYGLNYMGDWGQ